MCQRNSIALQWNIPVFLRRLISRTTTPMRILVVVVVVVVVTMLVSRPTHPKANLFTMPAPWGWRCENGHAIKYKAAGRTDLATLNQCKLTCGPAAMLWPLPTSTTIGNTVSRFLPESISLNPSCPHEVGPLLQKAFDIFHDNLQRYHPDYAEGKAPWTGPWDAATQAHTLVVDVTVKGTDTYLTLDTDESYNLSVNTVNGSTVATIVAQTFFGARHGLETLSQLVEYHETDNALMVVQTATVKDAPVFPYRGLMLDTSRNFVSVEVLQRTLDAMATSKLNTLHWHITDSHSFPLALDSFPNMAYYGAYSPRQVYTPAQVRNLVQYARLRGVRLLPELDAPAHAGNGWQWVEESLGHLVVCANKEPWQKFCLEPPCGQLNLANPAIYDVLGEIYSELLDIFSPVDLFHFGGDEVNLNCWNTTEEIVSWMKANGYGVKEEAYYRQWAVFQTRAFQLLQSAARGRKVEGVLWTSKLTKPGRLPMLKNPEQYIIQIWSKSNGSVISEILDMGQRVIFTNSDAWYLDCGVGTWVGNGENWCSPYKRWQIVYDNSPHDIAKRLTGSLHTELILGGEAALWTEQVDGGTVDSKLWPRAAALAERLWSNPATNWSRAETRFMHHRERLVKRGVQADRVQPQWCHQNEGLCYHWHRNV